MRYKMALVAYDSSSESENEDRDQKGISECNVNFNRNNENTTLNEKTVTFEAVKHENSSNSSENSLFLNLPRKKNFDMAEDLIEDFVPKSKPATRPKEKVKIGIPALSTFEDEDDDNTLIKKSKLSDKESGLISLLPPVRGTITTPKSFVPNIIATKINNNNSSNINVDKKPMKSLVSSSIWKKTRDKVINVKKPKQKKNKDSESDAESDIDDIDLPETFDDEMWEKVCGRPKAKQIIRETKKSDEPILDIAPEPEKPYEGLDNQAFQKLVGKSKRPIGNIKLIDVNEEEILSEKDLWMTKSLTDPEMAPKAQVEDPVDSTRRKKHHITYLAQQAKANEQELQTAWAASKNNRLATRAKYGF